MTEMIFAAAMAMLRLSGLAPELTVEQNPRCDHTDADGRGRPAGYRCRRLTRGGAGPARDRPAPLALSDDDLDFYNHDHQHHRQEVKMIVGHLFLQVEAGGKIPPASAFWQQCMNEWFIASLFNA